MSKKDKDLKEKIAELEALNKHMVERLEAVKKQADMVTTSEPEPEPEIPTEEDPWKFEEPEFISIPNRNYSIQETPVTVRDYEIYCHETGKEMPAQPEPVRPDNPVTCIDWHAAKEYATWLGSKTGSVYRLPTEDEFEHFAGDHVEGNHEIAVFNQNNIQPVRTKKPNKYGLYDVLGCVWEWQETIYE
jgi:formylglycine-generating enzyme required for sulfatase activity